MIQNHNIFEVYQGITPIKRVYKDDSLVWTAPTFLHPYLVSLSNHPEGEQIVNQLSAKLLDSMLNDKYHDSAGLSYLNKLTLEQLWRQAVDQVVHHTYNNTQVLSTELLNRRSDEKVYDIRHIHALAAPSEVLKHYAGYDVLVDPLSIALAASAELLRARHAHNVSVYHAENAIAAKGKLGRHDKDNFVEITGLHKAISATAKLGKHASDHVVSTEFEHTPTDAAAQLGRYEGNNLVDDYGEGSFTDSPAQLGRHAYDGKLVDALTGDILHNQAKQAVRDGIDKLQVDHVANVSNDVVANSVSSEDEIGFVCDTESNLYHIHLETISHEESNNPVVEEVSAVRGAAGCINTDETESVKFTDTTSPSIMVWTFPEQATTNLYIPMIYDDGVTIGASQNGSELILH